MRRVAWLLLAFGAAPLAVQAAEHRGRVSFNGVPVPGATVTATPVEGTNAGADALGPATLTTTTDEEGAYRFDDLAQGRWTIAVQMLGFSSDQRELTIGPAAETSAPLVWPLRLPTFQEIAGTLTLAAPVVAEVGAPDDLARPGAERAAINDSDARTAPASRAASAFQQAEVTAARAPEGAAGPTGPSGLSAAEAADLARQALDGFLINGSVNNGAASPFALPAAFGNNRPGQRSLYTGGLGIILANAAWDARPFSLTGLDTVKPSYADVQVAAVLGGPLRIPGLVDRGPNVFLGFQRTVEHDATTQSTLVPTALERSGDFSQTRDALGRPVGLVDPLTGTPFPDSRIPADRISPQAAALLGYYPLPNASGGSGYNYQAELFRASRRTSIESRLGPMPLGRNQLYVNGSYERTVTDTTDLFGFTDRNLISRLEAGGNWIRRVSLFFSHRLRYQFTRGATEVSPFFADRENVSGLAGILGNNQEPANWGPPRLVFASGAAGLGSPQFASNRDRIQTVASDSLWNRGEHNLAFGVEVRRQADDVDSQQDARGTFAFTGTFTGSGLGAGSDLADFLLGTPATSSIAFGNADKRLRGLTAHAYLNDDWRVSQGFTLNAGLRWEYETPLTEAFNRLVNLEVLPGFTAVAPVLADSATGTLTGARYPTSLLRPDLRGFEPRVGIAWRPVAGSSLVIRAGYGLYRNTDVYRTIALALAQQPPLSTTQSLDNTAALPLTLADGFPRVEGVSTNTFAVDPDFRVGYSQNWQVSAQRDLPAALTVTATYLGAKGSRLMQQFLPNTVPPGAVTRCPACPVGFVYLTSNGSSLRHAGQFQVRRRLRNGLTATAEYTLSKTTDDAATFAGIAGAQIAQDWLDLEAERARSSFDQRHRLTVEVQYTTGQGLAGGTLVDGLRGALLEDWTFVGQLTVASGLPLTPIYLASVAGTGVTGTVRAALTGAPVDDLPEGFYANPAAYTAPLPGAWGDAGRNSVSGPAELMLNAGIGRTFRFGERLNLDWRIDATNVLNQVTYADVNMLVTSPQFGLPNRANAMRKVQSTLRLRF